MHVDTSDQHASAAHRERLNEATRTDEKFRSELEMGKVRLDLLMCTDRELQMFAASATHQHYKGGLYRFIGVPKNADTGEALVMPIPDAVPGAQQADLAVGYEHLFPHAKELWVRRSNELVGRLVPPQWHPAWEPGIYIHRFRPIGKGWRA